MIRFRLKELMADKGFKEGRRVTMEEVARETGIHRTTLTKISNPRGYNATTDVIEKLCKFFHVQVGDVAVYVADTSEQTQE